MNDQSHHSAPRHEKIRFRGAEISDLSAMPSAAGHHRHWRIERRRRGVARLALAGLVCAALVAVAGVAAVSFLFTSEWGAEALRRQAEQAVRAVAAGKADASVGPSSLALGGSGAFGMRLTEIVLKNPQSGVPIASAGAVDFGVRLMPLLRGRLQIGSAVVSGGQIDLAGLPAFGGQDWTAALRDGRGLVDPDLVVREAFKALHGVFDATDAGAVDAVTLSDVEIRFLRDGAPRRLHVERASVSRIDRDTVALSAAVAFEGRAVAIAGTVGRDARTGRISAVDLRVEGVAAATDPEAPGGPSAGRLGGFTARLKGGDPGNEGTRLGLSAKIEDTVLDFGARGSVGGELELEATLAEGSHKIEIDRLLLRSARNSFDLNGAFGPRPPTGEPEDRPVYRFEMVSNKSVLAPEDSPEPALSFGARIGGTFDPSTGMVATNDLEVRTASGAVLGNAQIDLVPGGAPGVAFAVSLRDMPVAEVKQLWPWFSGGRARSWVFEHVAGGQVVEADVTMRVAPGRLGNGVPLSAEEINGRFAVARTRFDTFGALPPIRDAHGTVEMRGRDVDIRLASGTAFLASGRTVAATDGLLTFRNTALPPVVGRLDLDIAGEAAAVAELASLPPLNGPQRAGLAADDLTGTVSGHISSDVPLVKDVDPKTIDWKADLAFKGLSVARPFGDQKLSGAEGTLALLPDRATIAAKGLLNGVKATIAMVEPLRPEGPKRERRVQLLFDEAARKAIAPALNQLMSGTARVEVEEAADGRRRVSADLSDTRIDLPWVGWSKGAGVAASAQFTLASAEGTTRLKDFELFGNSFSISGEMTLSGGVLSEARFDRVQLNRGDSARATITRSGNRLRVTVEGEAVDARAIVKRYLSPPKSAGGKDAGPQVSVRATVASVSGFNGESFSNVELTSDGAGMSFSGTTSSGKAVAAESGPGSRLTLQSGDAGAVLRFLDLYKNVQGGSLKIAMGEDGDGVTRGQVDARDFLVVNEPRLASVVSTAPAGSDRSLSQAARKDIDSSRVTFERGSAQIERGANYLKLAKGVLRGPEIGATFQGTMYDAKGRIDMTGTFMPAYGVNRIFGEIPLVGELLGNGRDRGLIGVTFKLEGDAKAPRLQVNPLSVMAPGIFRQIFEFD